ncbi:nuclear transport factor 2 family protein [Congregibacter variabilis]|uniref:Nuclear transport factor 2 family protein n=1 Tax=Congregibacter variabilis TaxID=3081200 RepID=A0ABZ0I3N0_9GAMM|nr:nuclear transport factor 2 family protein [Congregibacter sp. IMCC43200]
MQTRFTSRRVLLSKLILLLLLAVPTVADNGPQSAINALLDDFHQAAADADRERYLGYFAADGVFMGTDDWERWPLPEFRDYVTERFAGGTGWAYSPEKRFVTMGPGGESAWFDEIVVSQRWGRFRGTGVLLKVGDAWKIAHYSLTALVPNERFADVAKVATEGFETRAADTDNKDN